jgi:hypothetical protein
MAKPYSILAAALVAGGRSLSTFSVAGANRLSDPLADRRERGSVRRSREMGAFTFQSPLATASLAERAPANAAARPNSPRL